jgi:hypothetical protein
MRALVSPVGVGFTGTTAAQFSVEGAWPSGKRRRMPHVITWNMHGLV